MASKNKGQTSKTTGATETDFQSMCGQDYNPAKSAVCQKTCAKENPADQKACVAQFAKTAQGKKAAAKKASVGMNKWNHRNGCQGDRIDQALEGGFQGTVTQLADTLKLRQARVSSHIKHLFDEKVMPGLKKAKDGVIYQSKVGKYTPPTKVEKATDSK